MKIYFPTDLRNLGKSNSLIREVMRKSIDLKEVKNPIFNYEGYSRRNFRLTYEDSSDEIISQRFMYIDEFLNDISEKTYISQKNKLRLALSEAVRNAHKHGNEEIPAKKIGLGYMIENDKMNFIVEDEGGKFKPDFLSYCCYLPYILNSGGNSQNYYQFSGTTPSAGHGGVGLLTMCLTFDDVSFHKSDFGGLLVKLQSLR